MVYYNREPIYGGDLPGYTPPTGGVSYRYGTWRWRFGAFSDRRGWPSCGAVWNERLVLAKDSTLYASVAGDFGDHSKYNELGEISADMAFVATIQDPNGIRSMIAQDKLLLLTASGMFALGPSNAAQGVGPGNLRVDRQNNEGASPARAGEIDGRSVYIGKSRRRVIEAEYDVGRNREATADLSRYARHIGEPRFLEIAGQKDPNRLVWALRADGTLACATYVPNEQVLGWATRPLAEGMAARSICAITDPAGELNQLWMAAEYGGAHYVLRLATPRQESDAGDPPMLDMAAEYEGDPATVFGPVPWLADQIVQARGGERDTSEGDAAYLDVAVDAAGMFTLPTAHSRVSAGLAYPCRVTTLPGDSGSHNGPAMGKKRRISRLLLNVLRARGLTVSVHGAAARPIEQLRGDSEADAGFAPDTGILLMTDVGGYDRFGQVTIDRVAPLGATIRAIQPSVEVQPR